MQTAVQKLKQRRCSENVTEVREESDGRLRGESSVTSSRPRMVPMAWGADIQLETKPR